MAKKKNVRVELTRMDYAKRGVIAIVVLIVVLGLIYFRSNGVIGGPDQITARVTNAGGSLSKGADVKMRGLIVGSVASITRDPAPACGVTGAAANAAAVEKTAATTGPSDGVNLACVDIKIKMNGGILGKIPNNVVAAVLPATVFGTSFVNLTTNGPSSSVALRAGAVVPADASQGTLELQQALDDINTLVNVINPAKLDATLTAAAQALDGRGDELHGLIQGLNAFLLKLNPQVPLLRTDIGELVVNLGVLQQAAPALLDGVGDSLGTLQAITNNQASLATLLTGGSALATQGNTLLNGINANLTTFVRNAAVIVNTFALYHSQAFSQAFASLQALAPNIASILDGTFAKGVVNIQSTTPNYYTAADCPTFVGTTGTARGDNCAALNSAAVGGNQ